jgi:RNA polymerase sigma-70 factor, ECF subfamily
VEPELRLERLVREHFGRVAAYLLARTDAEAAGEALARTLEVAWRRLDDIPTDPLPWLLGVARKVLADEWRTRKRHQALVARLTEAEAARRHPGEGARDAAENTATERLVAIDALATLTEVDREALLLVAWDGLTTRQAAAVLGCSHGAFAVRLFRARSRLKDHLDASPLSEAGPSAVRAAESGTTSHNSTTSEVQENDHE